MLSWCGDNIGIMVSKLELSEILWSGPLLTLLHEYFLTLLFKIVTKHSAEVLFNFPKCKKAVMCLTEIYVLDKLIKL